jgi:hypothetical protein
VIAFGFICLVQKTIGSRNTICYCISSGASATSEIERDVILAEAVGADAKVDFMSERLEKHEKFFEPLDLSVLFRKPSEVAILYGTGVRGYARSSFKSILRSSHCERTTKLSNIANKVTLHFSFLFVHNVMISGFI